jgi:hypothetical protein
MLKTSFSPFQFRISCKGLAANPNKTLSLPVYLLSVKERSGQGLKAQGAELRAQGKTPALLFQN